MFSICCYAYVRTFVVYTILSMRVDDLAAVICDFGFVPRVCAQQFGDFCSRCERASTVGVGKLCN